MKQKLDLEPFFQALADARAQLPQLGGGPPPAPAADAFDAAPLMCDEALEVFELETLGTALESFVTDLSASVNAARDKLLQQSLDVYYAALELSQQPEHAHLREHVENMRAAYRRDFGREIPERRN
jgi:hypothetical protein